MKQVVSVLILLLLVLLDISDGISHVCLPLRVLVQGVLDGMLGLFNGGQPGVEADMIHLLVMVAHLLIMVAIGRKRHTFSLVAT